MAGAGEPLVAGGAFGQPVVDAVHVRPDPGGGVGVERLVAAAGGVSEPGPAGEPVPGDGFRAEEGGAGALGAVALDLQLPGAVEGGGAALGVGEAVGVGGAEMGDAPVVAVELEAVGSGGIGSGGVRSGGVCVGVVRVGHKAHTHPPVH